MSDQALRAVRRVGPPLACVVILLAMWRFSPTAPAAPGATEVYFAQVRAAVDRLPHRVGPWVGTDEPPAPSAVEMLRPNVLLQRQYVNAEDGRLASLLFVHCGDTRDMVGHYPPVCYPAHGWTQRNAASGTLDVDGTVIPITIYRFDREDVGPRQEMAVISFFALPGGAAALAADMAAVEQASRRRGSVGLGAAQVQLVVGGRPEQEELRRIGSTFIAASQSLWRAVSRGPATDTESRGRAADE